VRRTGVLFVQHFLCCLVMALFAAPAAAHHSPAMFDQEQRLTLKGAVRKFQWANPHSYIQLIVKDDKGREIEWSIETGAPMYLEQAGWKPSSLKPGDQISVVVSPLRKQGKSPGALLIEATTADGKRVGKRAGKAP
jgi:hypothetical protein